MEKTPSDSTKMVEGIPLPDFLGILEDFTNGKIYDPIGRRIRLKIRQKVLGLAKNLEE